MPLRLIKVSSWETEKMIWAVFRQSARGDRFHMERVTENESNVAEYELLRDTEFDNEPVVLYFCGDCGNPLGALFGGCLCGGRYRFMISGEGHEALTVLDRDLPHQIVKGHNYEPVGGLNSCNRYEWKVPEDLSLHPGFKWP